ASAEAGRARAVLTVRAGNEPAKEAKVKHVTRTMAYGTSPEDLALKERILRRAAERKTQAPVPGTGPSRSVRVGPGESAIRSGDATVPGRTGAAAGDGRSARALQRRGDEDRSPVRPRRGADGGRTRAARERTGGPGEGEPRRRRRAGRGRAGGRHRLRALLTR